MWYPRPRRQYPPPLPQPHSNPPGTFAELYLLWLLGHLLEFTRILLRSLPQTLPRYIVLYLKVSEPSPERCPHTVSPKPARNLYIITSTFQGVPNKPEGMVNWHPLKPFGTLWKVQVMWYMYQTSDRSRTFPNAHPQTFPESSHRTTTSHLDQLSAHVVHAVPQAIFRPRWRSY